MRYKLAVLGLCVGCLLFGDDEARQKVQVSKTEKMAFPAGGTLLLQHSTGDVTIEGWDQPGIEITTTKSSKEEYLAKDRDKAAKELDRVQVSAKLNGNELTIATEYPHHRAFPFVEPLSVVTNFDLEYTIKVPRTAKLVVHHDDGEVHIDDVTGNIEATARQGLIALRLEANAPPEIDAKSYIGTVNSDFGGTETHQPLHFGHKFVEGTASAPQSLHLKIGYGDIVILKAHEPKAPPPVT
jgi:hypothetical protein